MRRKRIRMKAMIIINILQNVLHNSLPLLYVSRSRKSAEEIILFRLRFDCAFRWKMVLGK